MTNAATPQSPCRDCDNHPCDCDGTGADVGQLDAGDEPRVMSRWAPADTLRSALERIRGTLPEPPWSSLETGIVDRVREIRALGWTTIASCEGHDHRGSGLAWITLELPQSQVVEDIIDRLRADVRTFHRKAFWIAIQAWTPVRAAPHAAVICVEFLT